MADEEAACWLCGAAYRPSVTDCLDCRLPLLAPTREQQRIRELVDLHLARRAFEEVRLALAALPEVLIEDESVIWLTDAVRVRDRGVLAITTRALCWVPTDEALDAGALDAATIRDVQTWPGDGGQLRVTTDDDLHVFTEVGSTVWLGQFAEVLRATIGSPDGGRALAGHYDRPGG